MRTVAPIKHRTEQLWLVIVRVCLYLLLSSMSRALKLCFCCIFMSVTVCDTPTNKQADSPHVAAAATFT